MGVLDGKVVLGRRMAVKWAHAQDEVGYISCVFKMRYLVLERSSLMTAVDSFFSVHLLY